MPLSQTATFLLGVVAGGCLVGLGAFVGYRWGLRRGRKSIMESGEGSELLELATALSRWTSEYSGNVDRYQSELTNAAAAMYEAVQGDNQASTGPIIRVLDDIMSSNNTLRERLEDAEKQLDRQTRDIEAYLTEARTDALTGLPNRRAFDERLDEMFGQWQDGGPAFCMVMVDIDHFKRINDSHGHQEGDSVLKQVATLLNDNLKESHVVARFGGEEFAVLTPGPIKVAAERIDRVRKIIADEPVPIKEKEWLNVSISAGVSEVRTDNLIGPIVRRADEALYAAKGTGRNRAYFHDGDQPVLVGTPEVAMG